LKLRILFFGPVRDLCGASEVQLELPAGATTGDVFRHFASQHPALAPLSGRIMLARNQEFVGPDAGLTDNDEVALLPPVSGGADSLSDSPHQSLWTHQITSEEGCLYALTRQTINVAALREQLLDGGDGAVCVFEGVVRKHSGGRRTRFLDYECYEAMAIRVMAEIGQALRSSHAISRVAIVHRLGRLQIGEASVVVLVTSPHRRPSFEAALEGINRLKKIVPVWKKEYFEDGEVWVEGDWDNSLQPAGPHA
jgi:MoaE-MoaD fusion protein